MKFYLFLRRVLNFTIFGFCLGGLGALAAILFQFVKVRAETGVNLGFIDPDVNFILTACIYTAGIGAIAGAIWKIFEKRGPIGIGFLGGSLAGLIGMVPNIVSAGAKTVDWDVPLAYSLLFGFFGGMFGWFFCRLRKEIGAGRDRRRSK
ncbi:MAG TPA: hypothetical protein VI981_00705 [Candidatus Paceibacterota bacterium]